MPKFKQTELQFFIWINKLDAHHRLYITLVFALLVLLGTTFKVRFPINLMLTWLAYAGCSLFFAWVTIFSSHPKEVSKIAHRQDSSRTLVFLFVVGASFISLMAILILLQGTSGLSKSAAHLHVLLSIACVVVSWWLVHTIFTLRYAHFYYCGMEHEGELADEPEGGLEFPGKQEPDYLDFAYFSFVIGMTFQVSDVEISSRRIRRLSLMHALISFAFNTVILALSINVILGLVQK